MFADLPAKIMAAIKAGFLDPLAALPDTLFHWALSAITILPLSFWAGVIIASLAFWLMPKWAFAIFTAVAGAAGGAWVMNYFG